MASHNRKIQVTGGSTYIVSLPPGWIKREGLERGSSVKIDEANDSLVISSSLEKKKEVVKNLILKSEIESELLLRALTSIYISNFDTLIIKSQSYMEKNTRDTIKKFARLVMGVEIFEESSRSIVLQNVLDYNSFPISTAVRRMALNVRAMLEDTNSALESDDLNLLDNVILRDDEVDRYQLYVYRETNRGETENRESIYYLIFSRILERIADHSVNICKIWRSRELVDPKNKTGIIKFLSLSYAMYTNAVETFYASKFEKLNEIISGKGKINGLKEEILRDYGDSRDSFVLLSCAEECSRIGLYATDIAELAMDLILSRNLENAI